MNTALPQSATTVAASKTGFAFILVTSLFFLERFSNNLGLFPIIQHNKVDL
ncbi:hypothetical protein WG954_14755 [Lacibacter sp. H375]|uniref:hypothetical protein n=1 Tax=Lacibacter sp. H375 TaxID=3133424 RepID=UPI0030BF94D5